jgi:hypothetical protein
VPAIGWVNLSRLEGPRGPVRISRTFIWRPDFSTDRPLLKFDALLYVEHRPRRERQGQVHIKGEAQPGLLLRGIQQKLLKRGIERLSL